MTITPTKLNVDDTEEVVAMKCQQERRRARPQGQRQEEEGCTVCWRRRRR
jgi:hypothetical protein